MPNVRAAREPRRGECDRVRGSCRGAAGPPRHPTTRAGSDRMSRQLAARQRGTHARMPRRPFLVALAGSALLAAVEFTPVGRGRDAPAFRRDRCRSPGPSARRGSGRSAAPVDSARLERDVCLALRLPPARPAARPAQRRPGDRDPHRARDPQGIAAGCRWRPACSRACCSRRTRGSSPATVSSQGAIGLMQVMHFHAGEFDCDRTTCSTWSPTSATARGCSAATSSARATCSARCCATTAAS